MAETDNYRTAKYQRDNGTRRSLDLAQVNRKVSWRRYNADGTPENGYWRSYFQITAGHRHLQVDATEGYTNEYGKGVKREVSFELSEDQTRALFETLKAVFEPDLTTPVEWTVILGRNEAHPDEEHTLVLAATEQEATRLAHEWAKENGRVVWGIKLASDTW